VINEYNQQQTKTKRTVKMIHKHQLFKEGYTNVDYLISRKSTFIPSSVKDFAFSKRERDSIEDKA